MDGASCWWALWDRGAGEITLHGDLSCKATHLQRFGVPPRGSAAAFLASFLSEEAPFPRWRLFFFVQRSTSMAPRPSRSGTGIVQACCFEIVARIGLCFTGETPFCNPSGCTTSTGLRAMEMTIPIASSVATIEVPP